MGHQFIIVYLDYKYMYLYGGFLWYSSFL